MASHIDRILDDVRRSVELTGKSGEKTVFKENVVFTIPCENFEVPDDADLDGAVVDFDWFLKCSEKHTSVEHPSPTKSFWEGKYEPYGSTWDFRSLEKNLLSHDSQRRGLLYNYHDANHPPRILDYHFQCNEFNKVSCTVFCRSMDLSKVLPQDTLMTWYLLRHVAKIIDHEVGSITFMVSNAYVAYEDLLEPEEHILEMAL